MSWRTEGQYRGLTEAERDWVRQFDKQWDTKAEGRNREDALDFPGGDIGHCAKTPSIPSHYVCIEAGAVEISSRSLLEAELIAFASQVDRFTVPKQKKSGWSIHMIMKCGKRVRAHFDDHFAAAQAHQAIEELSFWFTAS